MKPIYFLWIGLAVLAGYYIGKGGLTTGNTRIGSAPRGNGGGNGSVGTSGSETMSTTSNPGES